jgi:hypothetical protein
LRARCAEFATRENGDEEEDDGLFARGRPNLSIFAKITPQVLK